MIVAKEDADIADGHGEVRVRAVPEPATEKGSRIGLTGRDGGILVRSCLLTILRAVGGGPCLISTRSSRERQVGQAKSIL